MSYLCVDGGQTKTAASLLDAEGRTLDSWKEGPLTTPSKPGAADNLRAVVHRLCEEAMRRSPCAPEAACFSLTGYDEGDEAVALLVGEEARTTFPDLARIYVIPDYVGNWAATTSGEPGIMVLSGGGAVAYGRDASGDSLKLGGWGHMLGDEGSGYWIGLEAIKAVFRALDGVIPNTELTDRVMESFGASDARDLLNKVYSGEISEAEIAGLVPLVVLLADRGDGAAARIIDRAAAHLAGLGVAMLERLGELPVHLSGGVFRASGMAERFERILRERGYGAGVSRPETEPWEGIFGIARGEVFG